MTISPPLGTGSVSRPDEIEAFARLKTKLIDLSRDLQRDPSLEHTSVVVPSLSVDQEELAKVSGAAYYEERLLFTLIRLRNPGARVIYLTSQPIHPDTVDYYLQLLVGVPASHAKRRLFLLSMQDGSPVPLTQKILERPRVLRRLRGWIGDRDRAYITCFNSTVLERRLAVALGIPLYGADPELLRFGTKSGSRQVFREAGVDLPDGAEDLASEDDVVQALVDLQTRCPGLTKAVVKLNEGFSGEGNAIFTYPEGPAASDAAAVKVALRRLEWSHPDETYKAFFRKFSQMGGIVEEFVTGPVITSPSVQLRVRPDGKVQLISTHDQVLGAATGQVYLGGRFPADAAYRRLIQVEGLKIGAVLSRYGVIGRFGIDFMALRDDDGSWRTKAVEINLRMGGTTPPFMALELLAPGDLDPERGEYTAGGKLKYYYATDNLKSPAYRGLLPEDLLDVLAEYGIRFDPATGTGVLFYMIGALSQFGKLGVVSIGNSREEADELYERTVAILDIETGAEEGAEHLHPLFDHRSASME